MRFPVPARFSIKHAVIFAVAIFLAQQINGTTILFSSLTILYIGLFVAAFNVAGGLIFPSGAWIFFNGTLSALIGLTFKNLIGEPGQSNLGSPNVTMGVYCAGMAAIGVAGYASRRLRPKRPFLSYVPSGDDLRRLSLVCLVLALAIGFLSVFLPFAIYTVVAQLNQFYQAAIVLGVFYEITSSGGRRNANWVVLLAAANSFFAGVLGFTKEGMLAPFLAWLLPCVVLGYRFSRTQLVGLVLAASFFVVYLTPYAQIGRRESDSITSLSQNIDIAWKYLGDLPATRKEYLSTVNGDEFEQGVNLYNEPQGLFDRLEMIAWDDALITETDQRQAIGIAPTYLSYLNLVPHFFYPNKPAINFGNAYAREIGIIPENDTTTGISFSPLGDAYHQLKWYGLLFIVPGVMFLLFILSDSLVGDVRRAPWGLMLIASFAHVAPEGLIGGQIRETLFAPLTVIVVWLLARFLLPTIIRLFLGHQSKVRLTTGFISGPRRTLVDIPTERVRPDSR